MRLGPIPVVGEYRGVPLHNMQSAERIAAVKADIDQVLSLSGIADLFAFAQDVSRAPEARLTAGALITARWQLCAEERRARPTGVTRGTTVVCLTVGRRVLLGLRPGMSRSISFFGPAPRSRARAGRDAAGIARRAGWTASPAWRQGCRRVEREQCLQEVWEWARRRADPLCLQMIRDYRECCKRSGPTYLRHRTCFGVTAIIQSFGRNGRGVFADRRPRAWWRVSASNRD